MSTGTENVGLAFALVIVSGLCTGVGALLVMCGQCVVLHNKLVLAGALGLSSGVMLYVSFVEILAKSMGGFEEAGVAGSTSSGTVYLAGTLCFFGGVVLMIALDKLVHYLGGAENTGHGDIPALGKPDTNALSGVKDENLAAAVPSSPRASRGVRLEEEEEEEAEDSPMKDVETGTRERKSADPGAKDTAEKNTAEKNENQKRKKKMAPLQLEAGCVSGEEEDAAAGGNDISHGDNGKLQKMGLMTALAIGIHNFPEGLATFVATLQDPSVGVALAVAIGIHNIPEGLCVSIPIYYSTGSRTRALAWALLSGISEPIGAFLGYIVLMDRMGPMAFGIVFGFVGGMMVYICLHELIPTAHRYDPEDKVTTLTIILGMAIMALSLVLFVLEPEPAVAAVIVDCSNATLKNETAAAGGT
jgi:ZIP family zinc transporter